MPRFAANLSMMFTEVPFLDRFDAAARAVGALPPGLRAAIFTRLPAKGAAPGLR